MHGFEERNRMEFRMADNDLCVQGCAVVTGGARGIGRAVCESLAAAGYNVAVNHSSAGSAQTAADLARETWRSASAFRPAPLRGANVHVPRGGCFAA